MASVKIAPEFLAYSREELLVLYSWLIARPVENVGALENNSSSGVRYDAMNAVPATRTAPRRVDRASEE